MTVTVVVLCVCVCLSAHAILVVHVIKSIIKYTIMLSIRFAAILKRCFSLNCLIQKLEGFFYLPWQGQPSVVDVYSAYNVLCTLCYMFAYA